MINLLIYKYLNFYSSWLDNKYNYNGYFISDDKQNEALENDEVVETRAMTLRWDIRTQ